MRQVQTIKEKNEGTEAKKSSLKTPLSVFGGVAGGVIGGIAGGPMGAIGGAGAGGGLGSTLGEMFDPDKPGEPGQARVIQGQEIDENAMQRRLGEAKQNRLAILRNAESALAQLPQQLREEYAGPIIQATMAEEKRKAMGA